MKKILLTISLLSAVSLGYAQSGNYVFSTSEAANFGTVDLATPGGQTWATDRSASPGYFTAVGTATYTGAADASNVNGYVKYYHNSAAVSSFTYPVGTGTDLRSLTISGTIPATGVYASAWIVGDPNTTSDPTSTGAAAGIHSRGAMASPIMSINGVGQWDWQDLSGDANGMTITVSIPDLSGTGVPAANLRLVGWNGTQWVNLSGTSGASGNTENSTLSGTMISGISAITIGSIDVALPVTLISFEGKANKCTADLIWKVATEVNLNHYEVEYAKDARSFTNVGRVLGGKTEYSFSYAQASGEGYYRLKIVDNDGQFAYSNVVKVQTTCDDRLISIYPNPANDMINIKGAELGSKVTVVNAIGQTVLSTTIASSELSTLNIAQLANGYYNIIIEGKAAPQVTKIIKQN